MQLLSHPADLFDGGPPTRSLGWMGIGRRNAARDWRRIAFLVVLGWLPLLILVLIQELVSGGSVAREFIEDYGLHARSLVAAPMFIVAAAVCVQHLGAIAAHFRQSGLVSHVDGARFEDIVASTVRLRDSPLAELAIVLLAYAMVGLLAYTVPAQAMPLWHRGAEFTLGGHSLAGWWHILVSLPLLNMLIFSALYRLALWARFLWHISKLDLQLIPAHPDRAAGLKFVGYSVRGYAALALTFSVIVAGSVAIQVFHHGEPISHFRAVIAATVAVLLTLFIVPLLPLSLSLLKAWRRGVFEYGALAGELGREFESKWLRRAAADGAEMLEAPDFSAATDLYQMVGNVHQIRFLPIDLVSIALFVGATLLPFLIVALFALPIDRIFTWMTSLFF
jgi:hypothetical protein